MHKPIKYAEKGEVTMAAGAAWQVFNTFNLDQAESVVHAKMV